MEILGSNKTEELKSTDIQILQSITPQANSDQNVSNVEKEDFVDIGMKEVYKSLTVLGDKIIKKLDELLKAELPEGIASLDPEQHTPEATAQRIVDGATALFGIFSKQNSEIEGEELISKFMATIRKGISEGYEQAASILGDLGAFEIDGIKSGIEETMRLVEEKLKAFEESYGKSPELKPKPEPAVVPEKPSAVSLEITA